MGCREHMHSRLNSLKESPYLNWLPELSAGRLRFHGFDAVSRHQRNRAPFVGALLCRCRWPGSITRLPLANGITTGRETFTGGRARLPVCLWQTVRRQPVFELAAVTVHRTVPLKWVRACPITIKKRHPEGCLFFMVPVAGLEPARCCHRWILSPLRLPIPTHRRGAYSV